MKITAIIAAAGIGKRMGSSCPKQYLHMNGRPIIYWTLMQFCTHSQISDIICVVEPGRDMHFYNDIISPYSFDRPIQVVSGGKIRQDSVANGLKAASSDTMIVLIHDGVRPFITHDIIDRLIDTAREHGACIVADPIVETVKQVDHNLKITNTLDRSILWRAGTPQAFNYQLLQDAMNRAHVDGFIGTDEASIVERLGHSVFIVPGDNCNMKITMPGDLIIADAILKQRTQL